MGKIEELEKYYNDLQRKLQDTKKSSNIDHLNAQDWNDLNVREKNMEQFKTNIEALKNKKNPTDEEIDELKSSIFSNYIYMDALFNK